MVPYAIFPHYILTVKDYFIFGLRPKYAESLLLVRAFAAISRASILSALLFAATKPASVACIAVEGVHKFFQMVELILEGRHLRRSLVDKG